MTHQATVSEQRFVNGINVTEYNEIVEAVRSDPKLAKFEFRASNRWDDGGLNRTTIAGFYGAGEEQGNGSRHFAVDAAEPPVLLGKDEAPNPVEFLLHALAGCLTSTIVYKCAARGIAVDALESRLVGDMDARRFLELTEEGRTGYRSILATFRVKANATADEIERLAAFSPVYDVVSRGTPVTLRVEMV